MQDIALTGLARAGKDTIAARLVERHGFVRVAFADRLKEAALKADPIIHATAEEYFTYGYGGEHVPVWQAEPVHLSAVVAEHGWEAAKDEYPEVRRFLQHYGQTIREIEPMFWIYAAEPAIWEAQDAGRPVVITDVRYGNEAEYLMAHGFRLVRVDRPGLAPGSHISEREMLSWPADETIVNDGTLEDLASLADALVTR